MKDILKNLLREELAFESEMMNEIDWDNTFSDVKKTCINPSEMAKHLNAVRANAPKKTKQREKFPKSIPFIHAKSHHFNDGPEVDVDHFIEQITSPPNTIISDYNEKIQNSGSSDEHVYATGVPAFRGLVYDIAKQTFFYVNTCPGAGSCALICYAMKGNYIRYQQAYDGMTRRLNYLLNYPDKYEEQLYQEIKSKCELHGATQDAFDKVIIRWNDSGDFFAGKYTYIAESVIDRLNKDGYNVESYGYTKVADVANNSSIKPRFSSGANKKQASQANSKTQATIIPKTVFKGLDINTRQGAEEIKKKVMQHFKMKDVITFRELSKLPEGDELKWNVIISKESGDNAAWRKDVANVLMLQH